jgi:hypothetical protein
LTAALSDRRATRKDSRNSAAGNTVAPGRRRGLARLVPLPERYRNFQFGLAAQEVKIRDNAV